ncbi:retrovirus-related Pol polyprotein from transposon 17.6 [Trichonephila clavipes]|nr:retrovirus-related Pol polyprotein from transposon 17.6 [Trichonephila clavipes]
MKLLDRERLMKAIYAFLDARRKLEKIKEEKERKKKIILRKIRPYRLPLTLNTGNYDPFKKFKMNMEINGIDRVCLRDSGSSIDVCSRSWINEDDLLGEYVWLKSPLDEICHCLPLAKIKIKTKKGEFYTKAAIKQDSSDNDLYLLGNRTAELLESDEQGVHLVNAVVTRSKQKDFPRERKRGERSGV